MSSFDYQLLLITASISANKDGTDEKMKKFDSKLDKLILLFDNMLHQNQFSSPHNDVEYGGLSKIINSTSKTNTWKYDPSGFQNPIQMVKVDNFHQLISLPCQIVALGDHDGVAEYNSSKSIQSTSKDNISEFKTSWLTNLINIINVASFHRLVSNPCHIFKSESLNPVPGIDHIFCKLHLPQKFFPWFWKVDEG